MLAGVVRLIKHLNDFPMQMCIINLITIKRCTNNRTETCSMPIKTMKKKNNNNIVMYARKKQVKMALK